MARLHTTVESLFVIDGVRQPRAVNARVVEPLPEHVCGFGSETWQGGATPWDAAIDWPTSSIEET